MNFGVPICDAQDANRMTVPMKAIAFRVVVNAVVPMVDWGFA
jgi:hypothetical protein